MIPTAPPHPSSTNTVNSNTNTNNREANLSLTQIQAPSSLSALAPIWVPPSLRNPNSNPSHLANPHLANLGSDQPTPTETEQKQKQEQEGYREPASNGTINETIKKTINETTTQEIIQVVQQLDSHKNMKHRYDFNQFKKFFLNFRFTLETGKKRDKKRTRHPVTFAQLFKGIQTSQFAISGSSAEPVARKKITLNKPETDIDLVLCIPRFEHLQREPFKQKVINRFSNYFSRLASKNTPKNDNRLFEAFTYSNKLLDNGGFKFSLKTDPQSPKIDITVYSKETVSFDTPSSSDLLKVDIDKKRVDLIRTIPENCKTWLKRNRLIWFNESIHRLLQRFNYRMRESGSTLLQPHIADMAFEGSSTQERSMELYRLLSDSTYNDKNEQLWTTLLDHLSTYTSCLGHPPEKLMHHYLTTAFPPEANSDSPAQEAFQKTLTYVIDTPTPRQLLLKVLNNADLHTRLWQAIKPQFKLISPEALIQLWPDAEQDKQGVMARFLQPATRHYLDQPSDQPHASPLQKQLLSIYLARSESSLTSELEAVVALHNHAPKHKPEWLSKRATQIMSRACTPKPFHKTTFLTLFELYKRLPIKVKDQRAFCAMLEEVPDAVAAHPILPLLIRYYKIESCLRLLTFDAPHPSKRCDYYDVNAPHLNALYHLNKLNDDEVDSVAALPWSLTLPCETTDADGTIRNYLYEPNQNLRCYTISREGDVKQINLLTCQAPTVPLKPVKKEPLKQVTASPGYPILVGFYHPYCPLDSEIYYPSGEYYIGTALDGRPHGEGEHTYPLKQLPNHLEKAIASLVIDKNVKLKTLPFTLKGEFQKGLLDRGYMEFPISHIKVFAQPQPLNALDALNADDQRKCNEVLSIQFKKGEATYCAINNFSYFLQRLCIIRFNEEKRLVLKKVSLTSKNGEFRIIGPLRESGQELSRTQKHSTPHTHTPGLSGKARNINGQGVFECEDYRFEGELENGVPHGVGQLTLPAGFTASIQAHKGTLIDPCLEKFEKQLTQKQENNGEKKSFLERNPIYKAHKYPYIMPSGIEHAYFSCYSADFGITAIVNDGIMHGELFLLPSHPDNAAGEQGCTLSVYYGKMTRFSSHQLERLSAAWKMPTLQSPPLAPPVKIVMGQEQRIVQQGIGESFIGESFDASLREQKGPFFLGIDLRETSKCILFDKPFKTGQPVYKVTNAPFFTHDRSTYFTSWSESFSEAVRADQKSPLAPLDIGGKPEVQITHTLIQMDYLGELKFHPYALDTYTQDSDSTEVLLTVPHGEGILYYQGIVRGRFVNYLPDGHVQFALATGEFIEAEFELGALITPLNDEGNATHYVKFIIKVLTMLNAAYCNQ